MVDRQPTDPGCCLFAHSIRRVYEVPSATRQLLILILAGWINRQEQDVIEYLGGILRYYYRQAA
jgi:hypothetical protein